MTDLQVITLYCEDSTHAAKRTIVTRFTRAGAADPARWAEAPGRSARLKRVGTPREIIPGRLTLPPRADKPEAFQSLGADDHPVGAGGAANGGRDRYRFCCELCRFTVAARGERLMPIFDRLAGAGVSSISLVALAARLT